MCRAYFTNEEFTLTFENGFNMLINHFTENDRIKLIMVMDGKSPSIKSEMQNKRRQDRQESLSRDF